MILFAIVEWENMHSIGDLQSKWIGCIIYEQYIAQVPVGYDSEFSVFNDYTKQTKTSNPWCRLLPRFARSSLWTVGVIPIAFVGRGNPGPHLRSNCDWPWKLWARNALRESQGVVRRRDGCLLRPYNGVRVFNNKINLNEFSSWKTNG